MKAPSPNLFRYAFLGISLLVFILCIVGIYNHLQGEGGMQLDSRNYQWIRGKVEKIEVYDPSTSIYKKMAGHITFQLAGQASLYTIQQDFRNAYRMALKNPAIKNKSVLGQMVYLQLRKERARKVQAGKKLRINPVVFGLKIQGNPIFDVEDLNTNVSNIKWPAVIGLFFIGGIALLVFLVTLWIWKMQARERTT